MRSNIVPDGVQTGCENGWRDSEQKLNGRRLNEAWAPPLLAFPTPAPTLAEYASSDAHSECVIYVWMKSVSFKAKKQHST